MTLRKKRTSATSTVNSQGDAYDVQSTIDLGVALIAAELKKLKATSEDTETPLDPEYTVQITKYLGMLISVGRDNRMQSQGLDLTKLSDEELDNLAGETLGTDRN